MSVRVVKEGRVALSGTSLGKVGIGKMGLSIDMLMMLVETGDRGQSSCDGDKRKEADRTVVRDARPV